jgi:hypothetical protein
MDSDRDTLAGGLPHSEIPGSTIARISPGLIAACHALHRLSVPRHPPDALNTLDSAKPATHRGKSRRKRQIAREDTLPHKAENGGQRTDDRAPTRNPPRLSASVTLSLHPVKEHAGNASRIAGKPAFPDRLPSSVFRPRRAAAPSRFRPEPSPAPGGSHRFEPPPRSLPRYSREYRCRAPQALACGGGERDRTDDLLLAKQALSQLSYTPSLRAAPPKAGGPGRI